MKYYYLFILLLPFTLQAQDDQAVPVTVLGTYHMANPGLDAANMKADDVMTEKRQKELEELAQMLKRFEPTKIMVESSFGSEKINDKYREFVDHQDITKLGPNESYQIGFRLANLLGHEKIYPVDYRLNIGTPSFQEVLENDTTLSGYVDKVTLEIQEDLDLWTKEVLYQNSIADFLAFMNSEEAISENHSIYLDFTKEIYKDDAYGGADMLSKWYERNIKIYQNITRDTDFSDPNEKILVIFGQGHSKILIDLFDDSEFYDYVNILNFLPEPKRLDLIRD
jgi:hypothetical protein